MVFNDSWLFVCFDCNKDCWYWTCMKDLLSVCTEYLQTMKLHSNMLRWVVLQYTALCLWGIAVWIQTLISCQSVNELVCLIHTLKMTDSSGWQNKHFSYFLFSDIVR